MPLNISDLISFTEFVNIRCHENPWSGSLVAAYTYVPIARQLGGEKLTGAPLSCKKKDEIVTDSWWLDAPL
jgi:hypothetical protein